MRLCSACAHLEPVVSRLCSAKSHKRHTCFLHLSAEHKSMRLPSWLSAAPCAACAFKRSRESPPSSAHPIARQQKHFGKRKASRPSPYCPPAKALRKKEKPPGLYPTNRLQKCSEGKKSLSAFILLSTCKSTSEKRKASRPSSYFPPAKALRKKKSLPAFILLPACKSAAKERKAFRPSFYHPPAKT